MAARHGVFIVVVSAGLTLGAALVLTLVSSVRVWPPPRRRSWQFWFVWSLTWTSLGGLVALGVLDWDSFVFDHWSRFLVGSVMVVGGLALVGWGVFSLGIHATSGLEGGLISKGPYRYSRNPQYVGEMIWLLGYAVVTNSLLVLVGALLACLLFLLVPFTEEPWLRERYGEVFDQYAATVPRFMGRITFRTGSLFRVWS